MSDRPSAPRIAVVVTHAMTARLLLRGQLEHLAAAGFRPTLVTSPGPDLDGIPRGREVEIRTVAMRREISPLRDLAAFLRLLRLFRELRPDLVNAGTPKAGLLAMLAARLAGVPVRIYTLRGLRLETARGWKLRLLRWSERLAAGSAQRVVCVSESLRRRAVELGIAPAARTAVIASGSSNGVDAERFSRVAADREATGSLRRRLGIPEGAPVVGFVGRFTRDKGIVELVEAFDRLSRELPDLRLLLLGAPEPGDPVPPAVLRRLEGDPRVVLPGFVEDTAPYYPLMDVLAFPSHREGFPNAPLEAAAAGVPTVAFEATGTVDAVVDGETGRIVPGRDVSALAEGLLEYLRDAGLRSRHGRAARERVERCFRREVVWQAWAETYRRALREAGIG